MLVSELVLALVFVFGVDWYETHREVCEFAEGQRLQSVDLRPRQPKGQGPESGTLIPIFKDNIASTSCCTERVVVGCGPRRR